MDDIEFEYVINNSNRFFPSWNKSIGYQVTGLIELIFFVYKENPNASSWCEIGSFLGESALLIGSFPFVKNLFCIDPLWDKIQHNQFLKRTKHISDKIKLIRSTSQNYYNEFKSNSIDVIYIDGDHNYDFVKKDLDFAMKVVRQDGFICGHDYADRFPGVIQAVDEFSNKYKLEILKFRDCSFLLKKVHI